MAGFSIKASAQAANDPQAAAERADRFRSGMQQLETDSGGRLGVALLDTGRSESLDWRGYERFAFCSTFKLLAAALVLARVDRGQERLGRPVPVRARDLVPYSPATGPHAGGAPMPLAALCEAAVTLSDNTAANLLLRSFGGPAGLTAYARSLGDRDFRLDRIEPGLNQARAGDPRDTTTPMAMRATLQRLLLGDALSSDSRTQLMRWLLANQTGGQRLRAGLPPGWTVADKTGTGNKGTSNDIGLLQPPAGAPWLVTAYLTASPLDDAGRERILAGVGRLVATLES